MSDQPINEPVRTGAPRPYWVNTDGKLDQGVYLGFERSKWPVWAWTSASQAAHWAADNPNDRCIIGPVFVPDDVPAYLGVTVPAERKLVEYAP